MATPTPTNADLRRFRLVGVLFIVVITAIIIAVMLLTGKSAAKLPAAASPSAADRQAPAWLIKEANAVGFVPTTEPGVGLIESKPASAAAPPYNKQLLAVGQIAPVFTLKTPQGQNVSLAAERGKVVLLEFFATWCPHCNAEAPHLKQLYRSLPAAKYAFISVNADSEDAGSVFAFHRYYGLPYPALLDRGPAGGSYHSPGGPGPVTSLYKVLAYPTFYVVNAQGRIAWASDGEQPDALLRQELHKASQ